MANPFSRAWENIKTRLATMATGSVVRLFDAISAPERSSYPDLSRYRQQADAYVNTPHVHSAGRMILRASAGAEYDVFRRVDEKLLAERNHPIELLMSKPNPYQSRLELLEAVFGYYSIAGNCYLFLAGPAGGIPLEIYVLRPDRVRIAAGSGNQLVAGYIYEIDGVEVPLEVNEVIHWKTWNPLDDYYGLSPLTSAATSITSDIAAARWNRDRFGKDHAAPSGIVTFKPTLSDSDFNRAKKEFIESFGGGQNKVGFMRSDTVQFQESGIARRDMDFVAGRKYDQELIFRNLGIPVGMVDPNATQANADTARDTFISDTIWFLLISLGYKLTSDLAPFYGDDLVIQPKEIRKKDTAQDRAEVQVYGPYMTINQVREKYLNMDPVAWGDMPAGQSQPAATADGNLLSIDTVANPSSADAKQANSDKMLTDGKNSGVDIPPSGKALSTITGATRQELARFSTFAGKRLGTKQEDQIEGFVFHDSPLPLTISIKALMDTEAGRSELGVLSDYSNGVPAKQSPFAAALSTYLTDLRSQVIASVHTETQGHSPKGPQQLIDALGTAWWQRANQRLTATVRPVVQDTVEAAAKEALSRLQIRHGYSVDPVLVSDPASRYANSWVNQFGSSFNADTRSAVYAIFRRWSGATGATLSDLLNAIDLSLVFMPHRADMFTSGENARLYAVGNFIAARTLAKALNVPNMLTLAQAQNIIPVHMGCQCTGEAALVFNKDGQPAAVDMRFHVNSKHPCPTCVSYDGKLFSDVTQSQLQAVAQ